MDAIAILKVLLRKPPTYEDERWGLPFACCSYCDEFIDDGHAPDCPWQRAREMMEARDDAS